MEIIASSVSGLSHSMTAAADVEAPLSLNRRSQWQNTWHVTLPHCRPRRP